MYHDRTASKGFTLLEIVVVIAIIGIVMSLAVISLNPDKEDELKTEADRLVALASLAAQESVMLSREYALELSHDGYDFLVFEEQQWSPVEDKIFRPRNLPQGIYMDVFFEGEEYDFFSDGNKNEEEEHKPRIFMLSSGEMTPFEIIIHSEDIAHSYHINGDLSGKLTLDVED